MALFMDYHQDLKLPAEGIAQIAEDTRGARADRFRVRQVELYHNSDGKVYCLLEGPDEDAIRALFEPTRAMIALMTRRLAHPRTFSNTH